MSKLGGLHSFLVVPTIFVQDQSAMFFASNKQKHGKGGKDAEPYNTHVMCRVFNLRSDKTAPIKVPVGKFTVFHTFSYIGRKLAKLEE